MLECCFSASSERVIVSWIMAYTFFTFLMFVEMLRFVYDSSLFPLTPSGLTPPPPIPTPPANAVAVDNNAAAAAERSSSPLLRRGWLWWWRVLWTEAAALGDALLLEMPTTFLTVLATLDGDVLVINIEHFLGFRIRNWFGGGCRRHTPRRSVSPDQWQRDRWVCEEERGG